MKKDYVPPRDGDKIPWATNLKTKIPTHGATLTLAAADITDTQTSCQIIIDNILGINAARDSYELVVSTKQDQNRAEIKKIRAVAGRSKASATATNGILRDLGFIGEDTSIDVATAQPVLKLKKDPSGWRIEFNLRDYFDGINIYKMSPPDDPSFTFLARDTSSPYIDTAPVVNGTRYHAYYVIGDVEVGLVSADVVVAI